MSTVLPADAKILEARVQDSLSRFLEMVADLMASRRNGDNPGSFLVCRFAESLGRLMMDGAVSAVWESRRELFGASLQQVGEPATGLSRSEATRLIQEASSGEASEPRREGAVTMVWIRGKSSAEAVRLSSEGPSTTSLWILRPAEDTGSAMWRWFKSYLPGLRSNFITLRALFQTLEAAAATELRAKLSARARQLVDDRTMVFNDRLEAFAELLKLIALHEEIDGLDLIEDLVVAILQELMGTGWAVRQVGRLNADRPSHPGTLSAAMTARPESQMLHDLRVELDKLLESSAPLAGSDPEHSARRRRLAEVSRCFRALLDEPDVEPRPEPVRGEEALGLLAEWTRIQEWCRLLCRPRPPTPEERGRAATGWGPAVERTLELLPRHLALHPTLPRTEQSPESRRGAAPSARNWLALWFSLGVLRSVGRTADLLDRESCALHADLAYVLREGLRFASFGQRADYLFQPSTYAAALRRLVEYHAHKIVGLPLEYNITRLLEEIGDQDGLNRYVAAEHLQHVLEIYVAGQFILSVRIDAEGGGAQRLLSAPLHGQTVAEALTSGGVKPSKERVRLLTQAYSLAAVFHDVGHILFPRDSIPHDSLDWDDPEIAAGLQKVEDSVTEAGNEVAQKCIDDLGSAYYSKEELARWRDELCGPEPNHGLLGAWYLHRVGQTVLDRTADTDGLREEQTEVLRMAVRAVLVHEAATGPIRTDSDPVAAMLIVCNEVFEWDPSRHLAPAPSSIGRSFHVMAADVPAREPRDAWIQIPSLQVRAVRPTRDEHAAADEDVGLVLDASLTVSADQETFPEIHIGLQAPQRLDVPVLRLWVLKAQSLGRLVPTRYGLCPTIVMRSRIDMVLSDRGLTTKSLLDRVAERKPLAKIRPALRAWLAKDQLVEEESRLRREGYESVHLGPLKQGLLFADLFTWLKRIEEEAWAVVQSIDTDVDDQPSSKRWGQG